MNLMLISLQEFKNGIFLDDFRARHITEILNLENNEKFKFGIIEEEWIYSCTYKEDTKLFFKESHKIAKSNKLKRIKVIIGLVRPITAKRIIKDLASIGVSEIIFFNASLSEKSYSCSKLFKEKKYEKYLIEGAMQGGITYMPKIKILNNLTEALKNVECENFEHTKILLEKKSNSNLTDITITTENVAVVIGPERGFTEKEVNLIKENGFMPYSISSNILRTETVTIVSSSIVASKILQK
ncbi:16S rRNA (uracil(1498)-N(3))-methyltransferase [Borrelia sp. BU AG58]|uniref:16S rRNA (uracil(1498)-N(3))-methyltransferase n=1 Tax=Borrelia sp. BU AG58 TaxID=2887345 RepID=UPI001E41B551|nr:16S rRNA (uracil(1498)-N(3))-methyltransferase [Borrelia sp. BU AG58]UER67279.1 16S rRNA (uracil(1498)-N(3))-methyltransferase [Borrelia sp. BU AG58]